MKGQVVFLSATNAAQGPFEEARALLRAIETRFGHSFQVEGVADNAETPEALALCRNAEAIWTGAPLEAEAATRHSAMWRLRRELGLPARVRPLRGPAAHRGTLGRSLDSLLVSDEGDFETAELHEARVREVARVAAELAQRRWGLVTLVQPQSGTPQARAWEERVRDTVARFPSIRWEVATPDAVLQRAENAPGSLDVILAEGKAADSVAEKATSEIWQEVTGFLGEQGRGLFPLMQEHAGRGVLAMALGLRCSMGLEREAIAVEGALGAALASGTIGESALWEATRANLLADLTTSLAI